MVLLFHDACGSPEQLGSFGHGSRVLAAISYASITIVDSDEGIVGWIQHVSRGQNAHRSFHIVYKRRLAAVTNTAGFVSCAGEDVINRFIRALPPSKCSASTATFALPVCKFLVSEDGLTCFKEEKSLSYVFRIHLGFAVKWAKCYTATFIV